MSWMTSHCHWCHGWRHHVMEMPRCKCTLLGNLTMAGNAMFVSVWPGELGGNPIGSALVIQITNKDWTFWNSTIAYGTSVLKHGSFGRANRRKKPSERKIRANKFQNFSFIWSSPGQSFLGWNLMFRWKDRLLLHIAVYNFLKVVYHITLGRTPPPPAHIPKPYINR